MTNELAITEYENTISCLPRFLGAQWYLKENTLSGKRTARERARRPAVSL